VNARISKSIRVIAAALLILAAQRPSLAGSATWRTNPSTGAWDTEANWMPNTVPNGSGDIATFGTSNVIDVSSAISVTVDSIVFGLGAPSYTITSEHGTDVFLDGAGVVNNSGVVQSFVKTDDYGAIFFYNAATAGRLTNYSSSLGGTFIFEDSSSAGSATFATTVGSKGAGAVSFSDTATAADSTITAYRGDVFFVDSATAANAVISASGLGGSILFGDSSTAGNAVCTLGSDASAGFTNNASADHGTFTVNGAQTSSDTAASVLFGNETTAAEGTFIINGGAEANAAGATMDFEESANAANANITVNGGTGGGQGGALIFEARSKGGSASVSVFGNGELIIGHHKGAGLTIGSLAGDGLIFLSDHTLTIGSNNQSTTFSGVIDGRGAITKLGAGTLTLSGSSTYSGATTVTSGVLALNNEGGSATGSGAVQVNAGALGGKGGVFGAVTIGSGATLAPAAGATTSATFTTRRTLTFQSGSTYNCLLAGKGKKALSDQVVAKGVAISSGAQFNLVSQLSGKLRKDATFTVISNTASTPISGTFANLPDGAILTVGNTKLQASYEGGDGNDLTLTVVQ
jgi:autotransporter-associated beta strand protein